ncbi:MAG: metallopeptidase [Clostridia bacterium]|nr:metallopeptidase [Clostridia bacterium]MBQ3326606.1 metallopeptidase [Clostridia bacterium]MBR0364087.1 metallopeptidase [Clostridia bacterium]
MPEGFHEPEMTEEEARLDRIARRIIVLSRSTIVVNMRYLDSAVFKLMPVPGALSLATDGRFLFYDPEFLLHEYQQEKSVIARDLLHVVLHCIFQHAFIHEAVKQEYWDLAVDIAVENLINDQDLDCFRCEREISQKKVLQSLNIPFQTLTAERIYRWLLESGKEAEEVETLRKFFKADEHDLWYFHDPSDTPGPVNNPQQQEKPEHDPTEDLPPQDNDGGDDKSQKEQEWEDISKRVQVDMETSSRKAGSESSSMLMELKELHRERYDYATFLRKFSVLGEEIMINDDEFDTVFYTYGLELYGDMPLIEPLEYKEVNRIRDFVIVIDTSASTSGDLIQKFMQKTYNILKASENFFKQVNLYLIQADMEVQEVTYIEDLSKLEQYIAHLDLKGKGGTDFRPAFEYVNTLLEQEKFRKLKGLIYFTDGYGTFPQRKPPYDTAFVFMRDESYEPEVPPWAIKLVLEEEDLV